MEETYMNRKLSRLLEPNLRHYLLCLFVFSLITALFSRPLAVLELAVVFALFLYSRKCIKQQKKEVMDYLGTYSGSLDALRSNNSYLTRSKQEWLVLSGSNIIYNCNLDEMVQQHIESGADITMMYTRDPSMRRDELGTYLSIGEDGYVIRKLSEIIARYHAEKSVYFAFAVRDVKQPERFEQLAPQIERTMIQLRGDTASIIDLAERYHCTRVQFWLGMFDETTIRTLHEKGIRCNLFYADTVEDYDRYFAMGIDTLLTNRMDLAARYTKKG